MSRSVSDFPLKNLFLLKAIKQNYATGCFYDSNTHFEMLVDQIPLISSTNDLLFPSKQKIQFSEVQLNINMCHVLLC